MSTSEPIALRMNMRIELSAKGGEPFAALLMSASPKQLLVRTTGAQRVGEPITVQAEPNFTESYTIPATVHSCLRRLVPSQSLDYFELVMNVDNPDEGWPDFLKSARTTCRQLHEDVRLIVNMPVHVVAVGKRIPGRIGNVSFGGLFLLSENLPDFQVGEMVMVQIHPPSRDNPLELRGKIVHSMGNDIADRLGVDAGFGIQLELDDAERFGWEELVGTLHKQVFQ